MATWRKRDLQKQYGQRSARMGRLLRPGLLLSILAVGLAAAALWEASSLQGRVDQLSRDLSVANARMQADAGVGPASPAAARRAEPDEAAPLPPLPPSAFSAENRAQ